MGGHQYFSSPNYKTYSPVTDYKGEAKGDECGCIVTYNHESHERNCWTSYESYTTYYLCELHYQKHLKELERKKEEFLEKKLRRIKFYDELNDKIKAILPDKKLGTIKDLLMSYDNNISFKKDGSVYVQVDWKREEVGFHRYDVFLGHIVKENKMYFLKNITTINARTFN